MQITEAVLADEANLFKRSRFSYRQMAQAIPIDENGEPMTVVTPGHRIAVRPFWESPGDLEGDLYKSYLGDNPNFTLILRQTVVERLNLAANSLPDKWKIIVKAGYRPLSVQYEVLKEVGRQIKLKKPGLSTDEALQHARMFVTDPTIMCPPHCTGAALDVDVININTGTGIDMGCPPNTDEEIAFTHNPDLSTSQKNNRKILLEAMFSAGFANLAHEWWHFSYGDQYWAAFYNQPKAIYDIIHQ